LKKTVYKMANAKQIEKEGSDKTKVYFVVQNKSK
jgi:hypothetical protein